MTEITSVEQLKEFIASDVSLIYFGASWCGPCKMLRPVMENVEKEYGDRLNVGHVDIDECKEIAEAYAIMNIPVIILFDSGEEKEKIIGYNSKADIMAIVNKHVS